MKKYYMILVAILVVAMLPAALLLDMPITITQPDGREIEIYASGDEFHNWLHDKDGYTIIRDENTLWYTYAMRDGDSIKAGTFKIGETDPKNTILEKGINLSAEQVAKKYERNASMRDYSNARSPHTGQFNNLVVFIKFNDDPDFSSPITYYDNMFNAAGNADNSMRNYFLHASYQQLTVDSFFYPPPSGTTILTYVDPLPRNYYRPISGSNPIGYDPDDDEERGIREQTMLANSIAYVEQMIPQSLVIDGDNDGNVDNVCFIIQGSPDGWAELLWPHRWVMYYVDSYIHGARVWDFNLQLESFLFSSGASVLAHEMFHSLGAPDLYRYYDSTITPIGQWDLMAGNSNPPQHMSVWMKYRYGEWIDNVPMLTESGTYTLSPVASSSTNNIYRIASWRYGESYVMEYRKGNGVYDDNLPGSGLLVYRLDTRENGNASGPPDELYLYRPNGVNPTTNGSLSMAHYNAESGRTKINETTIPSGFTGANLSGGLNLYNVSAAGETISFSVRISDIQLMYPTGGEVWFSGTNKTITWKAKSSAGNVSIDYSIDNGANWINIVATTPNDGSYTWMGIPILTTDQADIRVTLQSNNHTATCLSSFSIISEVGAPTPVYPENNAEGVVTNPSISWAPVFGASAYQFQMADDAEFNGMIYNVLNHPDTTFTINALAPFSTYYWRVATVSDIGYSEFCDVQSFSTGDVSVVPGNVSLVLPTNNAANQAINPILQWNAATGAYTYHLQLARNSLFTDSLIEYSDISATSIQLNSLETNTQYHWRVRAANPAGFGYFSGIRRFTTGDWVDNEDQNNSPALNYLSQNYPNPFTSHTQISFGVKDSNSPTSLRIYNMKGQLVRTLHTGAIKQKTNTLTWNGIDDKGKAVSSGIYYYRLQSGTSEKFSSTKKMLLIRD